MTERAPARHRAVSRPSTPFTGLTSTLTAVVGDHAATLGRGGVVVAVSSGLVAGMGLPAQAAVRSAGDTAQTASVPLLPAASAGLSAGVGADVLASTPVTAPTRARITFEHSAFAPAKAGTATTAATATREIATVSRSLARAAYLAARPAVTARHAASDAGGDDGDGNSGAVVVDDGTPATTDDTGDGSGSTTGDDSGPSTPAPDGDVAAVAAIAMRYVGIAYRYGGTTPRGFDCSGFTQYVYRQIGLSLPRTAEAQRRASKRIARSQAGVGDLVFYLGGGGAYHVGIYLGNGTMIDSPRTGKAIAVRSVYSANVVFGRVG